MQRKIYALPFDMRSTMYQAVGEYIARAARFEFQLIFAISELAGITDKKKMRIAFMRMTFSARLGTFKALALYWAPNTRLQKQIAKIVSAGHEVRLMRNSLAHGVWGHEIGGSKHRLSVYYAPESKDYYLPKAKHYTAAQLRAKAKGVRSLDTRLTKVIKKLRAAYAGRK